MKRYKGKTLKRWLKNIVAMDEAELKSFGIGAYLTEDNRILTGGDDWMKKGKISCMNDIIHKFSKDVQSRYEKKVIDEADNFVENYFYEVR
jgi:hypothetical protein